jgi:hypothetical protein
MSRFRFSIKYLLALVAVISGGCAALTSRTTVWAYIVCIVFGSLLVFAPVVAIYGRGRSRRFAGGFSVAAWLYLLLMLWSVTGAVPALHSAITPILTHLWLSDDPLSPTSPYSPSAPDLSTINVPLTTDSTTMVPPLVSAVPSLAAPAAYSWDPLANSMILAAYTSNSSEYVYILVVGHALAAIAIGFLAGVLAVVLAPADKGSAGA